MKKNRRICMALIVVIGVLCVLALQLISKNPQCQIWMYSHQIERIPEQSREEYYWRGIAYSKKQRYDLAINDYSKAIELEPQRADAYVSRGIAYLHTEKIDQALADFTRASELNPMMADAYNNRGGIYFAKGEYQRAVEDCTKAIEIAGDGRSLFLRGNAYAEMKEYDKAISDYQQAIQRKQDFSATYFALGVVYEQIQQYPEARAAYAEFITKAAPNDQRISQAKERIRALQ